MFRMRSNFINGFQDLSFNHGFRQLTLYSTEVNPNFVNYLVQNLGFSNQKALSASSKLTHNHLQKRFRSSFNGVQDLIFINGFHQLTLYSTSISTEVNPNFVNYLVENLGFSKKHAISISSKYTSNRLIVGATKVSFVESANSVVAFLKRIGLEQSQIRNAIEKCPLILLSKVDKTLNPKIEALQKLGFSKPDIAELVSVNPLLLWKGLNTIIVAIQTLREIMGGDDQVISVLKKSRCTHVGVIYKYLVQNVALLRTYGIPIDLIRKILLRTPAAFFRSTDFFKDAMTIVEEKFGIPRSSPQFLDGVRIVTSLSSKTIDSKMQVYKSFGWTDSDIARLVISSPSVLGISLDSLKKKLDVLMNELGYDSTYLASKYCLFSCSLEKRVVPRHKVLVVLKEKGLIRKDYDFSSAIVHSESNFLKKFVLPFKEVDQVFSKHASISLKMLTPGLSE